MLGLALLVEADMFMLAGLEAHKQGWGQTRWVEGRRAGLGADEQGWGQTSRVGGRQAGLGEDVAGLGADN